MLYVSNKQKENLQCQLENMHYSLILQIEENYINIDTRYKNRWQICELLE